MSVQPLSNDIFDNENIDCVQNQKQRKLFIRNTLTGEKERFKPIKEGKVSMYVCGMTVYDYCHIGHARVLIVFDMVNRYLRYIYGNDNVTYVRNITDIDDKIIARAIQNNEGIKDLTDRFIRAMHEDSINLGVMFPDIEPRATEHMGNIKDMIQRLIDKGFAYKADNGDIYYEIQKFKEYGKLSGKNISDLRAGSRVEINNSKRSPSDFVLWKKSVDNEPNSWASDWGPGRPGWHIECSAMAYHCLASKFDIHGGGLDLQFPHHENEIAQSEGCLGHKHVNYWMHNGFVRVDNEKMSKSVGNFFIIRDVLKEYHAEVIRFFILSSHYMSPLQYSTNNLEIAKKSLRSLYLSLEKLDIPPYVEIPVGNEFNDMFLEAMDDDFNTPIAISILFKMAHEINRSPSKQSKISMASQMKYLASLLGLLQQNPDKYLQKKTKSSSISESKINSLIEQREQARKEKDWAKSDEIRGYLKRNNVLIEDVPEGTRWIRG